MSMLTSGLRAWVTQRVSAIVMVIFFVVVPLYMVQLGVKDFASWKQVMATPLMVIAWGLFFLAVIAHAWVGIRDVILDYVHNFVLRSLSLSLVVIVLVASLLWVLRVLLLNSGLSL